MKRARVVLYHLESDDAIHAANWEGRKTAPFGVLGELKPDVSPVELKDNEELKGNY